MTGTATTWQSLDGSQNMLPIPLSFLGQRYLCRRCRRHYSRSGRRRNRYRRLVCRSYACSHVENLTLSRRRGDFGTGNDLANTRRRSKLWRQYLSVSVATTSTSGAGDTVVESVGGGTDGCMRRVRYTLGPMSRHSSSSVLLIQLHGNALSNRLDGSQNARQCSVVLRQRCYVLGAGDSIVEAVGGGTDIVGTAAANTCSECREPRFARKCGNHGTGNTLANLLEWLPEQRCKSAKGLPQ